MLCTVTKIEGTSVFVSIEGNGEGSIVVSEIAPGRIRNLRDYVMPNKKIVCKILKIESGHVHLSLRRVTSKEKQDVLKRRDQEKAIQMTLKTLLPSQWQGKMEAIAKEHDLVEFFQKSRGEKKMLESFFTSEEIEKLQPFLKEREKEVEIKKEIRLKCGGSNGLSMLKATLDFKNPGLEITYLAASRFVLKLKAKHYKEGNTSLQGVLEEIEKRAKKNHCEYALVEK